MFLINISELQQFSTSENMCKDAPIFNEKKEAKQLFIIDFEFYKNTFVLNRDWKSIELAFVHSLKQTLQLPAFLLMWKI